MELRRLGNSGTIVSAWCLGTMTFGAEADEATSFALMDTYVQAGGNFFDTADVYSNGVSEEIVGRWLKAHPTAARQIVVATKARFPMGPGPNDIGLSRRHLGMALDDSLKRLGVERIDLYQMHAWDALTPLEETLRFLDDAVRAGKIAYYGFSNYLGWQVTKAAQIAKFMGYPAPVSLQPHYNLIVRDIEFEIVPACRDAGMGLLPWSPLGGGWLTGKYKRDSAPTGATRLGENPNRGQESYGPRNASERVWKIIDTLERIGKGRGVSMAEVALSWLAERPAVTRITIRPPQPVGGPEFTVRQTGDPSGSADRAWRVRGNKPERWVRQTDFSNDEAVGFLADRLNRLGVETRLTELGAEAGDAVLIGPHDDAVVFDFRPGIDAGVEMLGRRGEDQRIDVPDQLRAGDCSRPTLINRPPADIVSVTLRFERDRYDDDRGRGRGRGRDDDGTAVIRAR